MVSDVQTDETQNDQFIDTAWWWHLVANLVMLNHSCEATLCWHINELAPAALLKVSHIYMTYLYLIDSIDSALVSATIINTNVTIIGYLLFVLLGSIQI